jgi:hypothetical protein
MLGLRRFIEIAGEPHSPGLACATERRGRPARAFFKLSCRVAGATPQRIAKN